MASTMNLMDTMPAASQCARGVRCAQSGSACHTRCLHLSRASCLCLDVLMCLPKQTEGKHKPYLHHNTRSVVIGTFSKHTIYITRKNS